jgi:branched-chain amino acid transport system ATP-binding protein
MEALKVEGLSKDFGGVKALHEVSFSAMVGEHLAIIGPNGAGKTTLFNVLNGQLSPTTGQIYLFGQEVTSMPTYRRAHLGLSRSFQLTSLFFNLTVIENALLALQGTKPPRFQMLRSIATYDDMYAKAQELLTSMDLWEKRANLVEGIGYGEQRKLELALSLASEPKLLLLDEPSCGLTSAESADIIDKVYNLGTDITVIIVAHDMDLVFSVTERILVLHYGKIIAEGTPEEIQADSKVNEIYMGMEQGTGGVGAI